LLRNGATDAAITGAIAQVWEGRADRYSQLRGSAQAPASTQERRIEMSYIGG
jgi:GTP 3',8-cyclase